MESESWLGLDWQAVEAIGTCVGILILILAGCLACRQLSEAKRARNAQLAFPLFTELRSDEMKEHLRKIYDLPAPGVSAAVEKDVSYVLDRLEFLGILLALELVDEDLVLKTVRQPLRVWYKLRYYIEGERGKEKRGHYGMFAKYLASRSLEYQLEKRVPEDQQTHLKGANLVKELRTELEHMQKPIW